jgi:hypothetical protein
LEASKRQNPSKIEIMTILKKKVFESLIIVIRVNIFPPHDINLKPIRKLIMKNLIPIFFHSNCDIANRINRQLDSRTDPTGVYVNKPSIILVY